jgi:hypothetical protein
VSRIAEAAARAGVAMPLAGDTTWEKAVAVAEVLLEPQSQIPNPKSQNPNPNPQSPNPNDQPPGPKAESAKELPLRPSSPPETIDFELTAAMRRIFLSPKSTMKSVLFCTVPGDHMSDVAWRAAEVVATQSGKRVAFVEDGTNERVRSSGAGGLITRVGWYAADSTAADDPGPKKPAEMVNESAAPVLGEHVTDLFSSFDFAIVSATAPTSEDLVPLAQEVDGVIVVVTEKESRRDAAEALVEALRASGARLLGAVFANLKSGSRDSLFHINA